MKEKEMDGASGKCGDEERNTYLIWRWRLVEIEHVEDLGVDGSEK